MSKTSSSNEIAVFEEKPKEEEPIRNLFSMLSNFKFDIQQLPFFNLKPKHNIKPLVVSDVDQQKKQEEEEEEVTKHQLVRFPKSQVVVPPPLEAQHLESSNNTSNPVILWQVCAIGAFFISRWVWARWNERKGQGRSPNDGEGRSSDDGPPSSDNE